MYESFYGFKEKPFHVVPNPNFLYLSAKHQNALTYMEYGLIEGTGFMLLTGEIGTGKTTLVRHILKQIETEIDVAVIFNTNVTAEELLTLVLQEFELTTVPGNKARNIDTLYEFLISRYATGKRTLLIIDEAQNLSREALEEVRMLSNLQSDDRMLLQIMLVGQPELKAKLKSPTLAQLAQRITVGYHLVGLSREDVGHYITTRLEKAGGPIDIFTPGAIDRIFKASNGIPRLINIICDSALVYGFADELRSIDMDIIEQVVEDKGGIGLDTSGEDVSTGGAGADQGAMVTATAMDDGRLVALEQKLMKLQLMVDWQVQELEKRADAFRDTVVESLKQQLDREREMSDRLLQENALLKAESAESVREIAQKSVVVKQRQEPHIDLVQSKGQSAVGAPANSSIEPSMEQSDLRGIKRRKKSIWSIFR